MDSEQSPSSSQPSSDAEFRKLLAPGWSEYHRLLTLASDGQSAVAVQVEIHHDNGARDPSAASFVCSYFRVGELAVVLAEEDIVAPAERWELRASGLWADMICEQPFKHWTYGLEAFGLAIDEPDELLGRGYGDRVPLGWELDFESSADKIATIDELDGYSQTGEMHGIVLLAEGSVPIEGEALRHHWWGRRDSMLYHLLDGDIGTVPDDGSAGGIDSGAAVALPIPGAVWRLAHRPGWVTSATGPI